jgi:predicted amidohydrolase
MELTIALAQMSTVPGRPEVNYAAARERAAQAAAAGAGLLMLPELWATGYDLERAAAYAAPLPDPIGSAGPGGEETGHFGWMAALARAQGLYVLGTALQANPAGRPFNTAALFSPGGECLAAYQKTHLFPPLGETVHMAPGTAAPTFDLPWGRTALAVCYDLRFPELWRGFMAAGARLVLIPAEWPIRRVEHWRLLLRARAVENQFFVAGCNRAGEGSDCPDPFGGYSAVVDPWGRVLAEAGPEPDLVLATFDLDEVDRCRTLFPWLNDRRPDLYSAPNL